MAKKNQLDKLKELLIFHLSDLYSSELPWQLKSSKENGRGAFATRDISVNEIIFRDCPLLIGPRFGKNEIICSVCFKVLKNFNNQCKFGCNLPLCESCQSSPDHQEECELICNWQPASLNNFSLIIYNSLSILRGLILKDKSKELLEMLQGNISTGHNMTVEILSKEFKNFPDDENLKDFLRKTLSILHTNAFETILDPEKNLTTSVLGLYSISGILNHHCIPNTRYTFDKNHIITFRAIRPIKKDEEIFNSYTRPFLPTPLRQILLKQTKQFLCNCDRCTDPTECQTFLGAMKCADINCTGILLPANSMDITSNWKCSICESEIQSKKMFAAQKLLSNVLASVMQTEDIRSVLKFIREKLKKILPETNQLAVEIKLFTIWKIGRNCNDNVKDYGLDELLEKEKFCLEVIKIFEKLRLEESIKAGKIYYELYKCRNEIANFNGSFEKNDVNEKLLERSWNILGESVIAPADLRAMIKK